MAVDYLDALLKALAALPGIGEKTAQRLGYHLLQHKRKEAQDLLHSLGQALEYLGNCQQCNSFSSLPVCATCSSESRDKKLLCVVEMPIDVLKVEQTNSYNGLYFVLQGRIAPLQGEGLRHIGIEKLLKRCLDGVVTEVILATSFTAEGDITAHNISQTLQHKGIKVSRLARGVPAGAELEYMDAATLAYALWDRQ